MDVATNVAFCRERPPWRSAELDDVSQQYPTCDDGVRIRRREPRASKHKPKICGLLDALSPHRPVRRNATEGVPYRTRRRGIGC